MPTDQTLPQSPAEDAGENRDTAKRPLTPAAERALAEAAARRAARAPDLPKESGGRGGLDPARYGDWEIKGLTSDF